MSKTVDSVKHTYAYVNGLLMYETRGSKRFWYSYDANGVLYSVRYTLTDSGTLNTYYFTHNSRGDIVGIYDTSANLVAQYEYDAWGKVLSVTNASGTAITSLTHIANLNPFRYRGYFYDKESGLYYLMSRYYDPVTHRFVNADGYFQSGGDVLDANMNAYCRNNPIMFVDPTGERCYLHETGRQGPLCPNGMTEDCCYIFNGWNYRDNCPAEQLSDDVLLSRSKNKDWKPRKDRRKGSENRQKSDLRERNVGHPNGEEHSRVPKGNGLRRIDFATFGYDMKNIGIAVVSTVTIIYLVGNNVTGVGVADDLAVIPLSKVAWDAIIQVVR